MLTDEYQGTNMSIEKKLFHVPVLDGLRALSILLVFLAHIGRIDPIFSGSLGVTLFFFISGYLIASLLRLEYEKTGDICFWNFYVRRTFRIFFPFYLVFGFSILLGLLGVVASEMTSRGLFYQAFFLSNYWDLLAQGKGGAPHLSNLWSLAVEEHFYLFFPLFFWGMQRFRLRVRAQTGLLFSLCGLVLVWRVVLFFWLPQRAILISELTDTRIDSILFGCILAVCGNPMLDERILKNRGLSMGVLLLAVFALFVTYFLSGNPLFSKTLLYSIQGLAFLPLFAFAIRNSRKIFLRIFDWGPSVFLGRVSYTFYLVHLICLGLLQQNTNLKHRYVWILAFLLAVVLSCLMRWFVELPLGKMRRKFMRRGLSPRRSLRLDPVIVPDSAH